MKKSSQGSKFPWIRGLITVLLCLAVLGVSAAAIVVINQTEPTAERTNSVRKSAALVETLVAEKGTYAPRIVVLGSVEPARQIVLSPRVDGQVVEVSSSFVPGGMVHEGEVLVRLDQADFENALVVSQTELQQAEASLRIERGRQSLAQKELALLEGTIDDANRELVLRKPQIESIQAEVSAAKASIARAKLNLDRTTVTAPFDAQLLRRSVDVGSQVSPGDELAQLVGIAEYWVMASVPVRSLNWVQFPADQQEGSAVTLRNPGAWPSGATRHGRVARMLGQLDEETRLARVLITVDDPLALKSEGPPLILDTLVETEIEGKALENVVRLRRDYVREGDTVWVLDSGQLAIREVDIVFRDADYVYIRAGLDGGEEVVTTTLATVAEGIGLRKANSTNKADNPTPQAYPAEAAD